ncbi:ribonuclease H-like domain-containing protein [Mycena crocata]|nr:ribonuclease H-like domain-containing protein [Mycena crocata]
MSDNTMAPTSAFRTLLRKIVPGLRVIRSAETANSIQNDEAGATDGGEEILEASKNHPTPLTQDTHHAQDFPKDFTVFYITTEFQANEALKTITDGEVGFDTEFTDRRPTKEERWILKAFPSAGAARRAALTGWQVVELQSHQSFPIAWDNIGLRLVQIYQRGDAWVLDMWKIKAFPRELKRILESSDIVKTGVGLIKDISIIWDDLRFEMKNVVDAGMMARLHLIEKHQKTSYTNLALKVCVEELLGYKFPKELAVSDWKADELSEEQILYAAQDAVASHKVYTLMKPALQQKSIDIGAEIPAAWYTFNTRHGEPTRMKKAADGSEVVWKTSDCTWFGGGKYIGVP